MELMTIEEVTEFLRVKNKKAVQNWLDAGILPKDMTVKIGRARLFIKSKLEEFINGKIGA